MEEFEAQYMIMKKENWRIYTNKEMYAIVRKPIIIEKRRI